MPLLHSVSIAVHVVCGLAALVIGLILLARPKGDAAHRLWGRIAALLFCAVVATAGLGLVLFRREPTLAAVTLLSGYLLVSGWRVIRSRGQGSGPFDLLLALVALASGVALFDQALGGRAIFWKPQVTLPIAGSLMFWSIHDLSRPIFPPAWTRRVWRLEHGAKMTVALSALASAGAGTVLPQYAPWSQIGPSLLATVYILAYVAMTGRRHLTPARL